MVQKFVGLCFAVPLLVSCFGVLPATTLRTYELPSNCRNVELNIDVSSPEFSDSSGIVVNSLRHSYSSNSNCSILLKPKFGSSILLAIRKFDFRKNCKDNVTITDSLNYEFRYCGSSSSDSESITHVSHGNMRISFQSGTGSTFGYKGFEFVFTAFYTGSQCFGSSLFRCNNGNCIYSKLRCDGHNHCGDKSDQKNCGPSGGAIAGYVIGSIFLVIAFVAGIIYCTKKRRVITSTTTTYPAGGVMYPPPYGSTPAPYMQPQYQPGQPSYNPNYR